MRRSERWCNLLLKHQYVLGGVIVVCFILAANSYILWERLSKLERRAEIEKVVRAGKPVEYLDEVVPGGYISHKVTLDGSPATLRVYTDVIPNDSRYQYNSIDFVVVVDQVGLIRAAYTLSDGEYNPQFRRFGIENWRVPSDR